MTTSINILTRRFAIAFIAGLFCLGLSACKDFVVPFQGLEKRIKAISTGTPAEQKDALKFFATSTDPGVAQLWNMALDLDVAYLPDNYKEVLTRDANTFLVKVVGASLARFNVQYETAQFIFDKTLDQVTFNYFKEGGRAWYTSLSEDPANARTAYRMALLAKRLGTGKLGDPANFDGVKMKALINDTDLFVKFLKDDDVAADYLLKSYLNTGISSLEDASTFEIRTILGPAVTGVPPGLAS